MRQHLQAVPEDDGISIPEPPATAKNPLRSPVWAVPLNDILDAEERLARAKATPRYCDLVRRLAA